MTVGELALLYKSDLNLDLELEVVACQGWTRSMYWRETGIPWVLPSPNMPTPDTALVYPGGCLIEGTILSEGRGTTRPFELWGAPWLDPYALADAGRNTPGASVGPCAFRPMFHKHAGHVCLGAQPHVHTQEAFDSLAYYTRMIGLARSQSPERFAWRTEPYEFVTEPIAIDLLYGSSCERELIDSGDVAWLASSDSIAEALPRWQRDCAQFLARRQPFLLYR